MARLEAIFTLVALVGTVLGLGSMLVARLNSDTTWAAWAKGIFVANLVFLGSASLFAAILQAQGLVPLGLTSGALVAGMLWEMPHAV